MKFPNPYWSNKLKMSALQRWIIVHSILYYEMSSAIVSDKMFDNNAKQLVAMQNEFPDEAENTEYWYMFYDFDGSTGFDLFGRLNKHDRQYLVEIANIVLAQYNKSGGKHEKDKKGKEKKARKNDNRK